jgi:hypothetical protein
MPGLASEIKSSVTLNEKKRRSYSPSDALAHLSGTPSENTNATQIVQLSMKHAQLASSGHSSLSELAREVEPTGNREIIYSRIAADILADISAWAYADCETLVDELHHRGIVGVNATCKQVSVSNYPMLVVSTAFFVRCGNVGVLAFRGTDPLNAINFLTDANCQMTGLLSLGHVHSGFYRNVRSVWFDIVQHVQAAIDDPNDGTRLQALYVTGHSLGAAMAALAGAIIFGDSAFMGWRKLVQGIYTYGQPMVGDKEFARICSARFGSLLFRHVYDHDLVPHLPPVTTGQFTHFGSEFVGSEQGWSPREKFVTQAKSVFLAIPTSVLAWAFKQLPLLNGIRLPYSIDDHSPNAYLQAFRAARD